MATNRDPIAAALAAADPALNYQPDQYDMDMAKYYAEQEALMAKGGKGGEMFIPTFPQREQPVFMGDMPPIEVTAQDLSNEPNNAIAPPQQTLGEVLQTPNPKTTLTPCDYGMCDGLTVGNVAGGTNYVASSAPTGQYVVGNANNPLAQMLTAGYLESRGATPEAVEKNNMRKELANLNNMRRTPEWNNQYQAMVASGMNIEAASAQADRVLGNQLGGDISSTVSRYADSQNQRRVQAAYDADAGRLMAAGLYNQLENANYSLPQGYQASGYGNLAQTESGNLVGKMNLNGQQFDGAEISPNRLMGSVAGAGATNASLGNTLALTNSMQAQENQAQTAANENAYREAQLGINVLTQQGNIANREMRNELQQQSLEQKLALQQAKLDQQAAGGGGSRGGKAASAPTRQVDKDALKKSMADFEKVKQAMPEVYDPDGGFSKKHIDAAPAHAKRDIEAYNRILRLDTANSALANDPEVMLSTINDAQMSINYINGLRNYITRTGFQGTNARAQYEEYGRSLNFALNVDRMMREKYDSYRSSVNPKSSLGIKTGS